MEEKEASTRPSIGFPLGLALLLIMIFCITSFLSCCIHWDKIRSLLQFYSTDASVDVQTHVAHSSPPKLTNVHVISKKDQAQSLSVLMPGDEVPKFIAMACPSEPSLVEKVKREESTTL